MSRASPQWDGDLEVRIDSVRQDVGGTSGTWLVLLQLCSQPDLALSMQIGERGRRVLAECPAVAAAPS